MVYPQYRQSIDRNIDRKQSPHVGGCLVDALGLIL